MTPENEFTSVLMEKGPWLIDWNRNYQELMEIFVFLNS